MRPLIDSDLDRRYAVNWEPSTESDTQHAIHEVKKWYSRQKKECVPYFFGCDMLASTWARIHLRYVLQAKVYKAHLQSCTLNCEFVQIPEEEGDLHMGAVGVYCRANGWLAELL